MNEPDTQSILPESVKSTLNANDYDSAFDAIKRLTRTIELLMLAGYISPSKVEQAFSLADP